MENILLPVTEKITRKFLPCTGLDGMEHLNFEVKIFWVDFFFWICWPLVEFFIFFAVNLTY